MFKLRPRNWQDICYLNQGTPRQRAAGQALGETQILQKLSDYDATLVGTIPLDIDLAQSDLDIICECGDLMRFAKELQALWGDQEAFELNIRAADQDHYLLASFLRGDFRFEIFAQDQPVKLQNAYLHMIAEDALLLWAAEKTKISIRAFKCQGLSTEEAFAKHFGIPNDPCVQLRGLALRLLDHEEIPEVPSPSETHPNPKFLQILEKNLQAFLEAMAKDLATLGLLDPIKEIDHLCYRCESHKSYQKIKTSMYNLGTFLSEADVNGRPISIFRLYHPAAITPQLSTEILELAAPHPDKKYREGFEHIEAIPLSTLEELRANFAQLPWESIQGGNSLHRYLPLRLPSGNVKFHLCSLENIVVQEMIAICLQTS